MIGICFLYRAIYLLNIFKSCILVGYIAILTHFITFNYTNRLIGVGEVVI